MMRRVIIQGVAKHRRTSSSVVASSLSATVPCSNVASKRFLSTPSVAPVASSPVPEAAISAILPRGPQRQPLNVSVGDVLSGWRVTAITPVPEFKLNTIKLIHEATGAEHLHIDCDDNNNVFSVAFRTPPTNDAGLPHILEHTTLCGSQRYPVRDPFFNMLKRSLNSYMNAWTASDYTMYPFSTQNARDFENLLSVYLDATFFPILDEADFRQEGHRLEFEEMTSPDSKLQFKGVVFNEMKGAMSDQGQLFATRLQQHLHPSVESPYHYNSGGEPSAIPSLTHEQLVQFHRRHYHPSNARFFTYGDLPLQQHLNSINELVLSKFTKTEPVHLQPKEPRLAQPITVHETCALDPLSPDQSKQTKMAVSFLCNENTNLFESFSMRLLSNLLLEGPKAPLYKALIDSKLAPEFAPGTGYDPSTRETSMTIGVQGIASSDASKIEQVILQTLEQTAAEGFEAERIEAEIHQIELSMKHVKSNFGLNIASSVMHSWCNGGDPVRALFVSEAIQQLRERITQGPYFQNLIRSWLLQNTHRVTMIMEPDEQYTVRQAEDEEAKLKAAQEQLKTEEDRTAIVQKALDLKQRQEKVQDISILPTLHVSDISPVIPYPATLAIENLVAAEGPQFYANLQTTNGVLYYRALFEIDHAKIPEELKLCLPILTMILPKMGAGSLNYFDLSQQIDLHTGGVGVSQSLIASPHNLQDFKLNITVTSHCLQRNADRMFSILSDILSRPDLTDRARFKSLVAQAAVNLANSITDSGTSLAVSHAASSLHELYRIAELFGGITHIKHVTSVSAAADHDSEVLEDLVDKVQALSAYIFSPQHFSRCMATASSEADLQVARLGSRTLFEACSASYNSSPEQYERALDDVVTARHTPLVANSSSASSASPRTFFAFPLPINYAASVFRTVPLMHEDSPKLQVATQLLSSCFMHKQVREKGGAYGGSAGLSQSGLLTMTSYRDPRSIETIDTFARAGEWLLSHPISQQEIDESKLEIFQHADAPQTPSARGLSLFTFGLTDAMRQRRRDGLFGVQKSDILGVAEKYLAAVFKNQDENVRSCIVGSAQVAAALAPELKWNVVSESMQSMTGEGDAEAENSDSESDSDDE